MDDVIELGRHVYAIVGVVWDGPDHLPWRFEPIAAADSHEELAYFFKAVGKTSLEVALAFERGRATSHLLTRAHCSPGALPDMIRYGERVLADVRLADMVARVLGDASPPYPTAKEIANVH